MQFEVKAKGMDQLLPIRFTWHKSPFSMLSENLFRASALNHNVGGLKFYHLPKQMGIPLFQLMINLIKDLNNIFKKLATSKNSQFSSS